ncbi:endonuclease/exonuclease/phosphatase family protein [uncultured Clostridium sp.]|uniref:endonuclease/exonuclease/phosphatase family protein n=1 Tax=uncultured Clostridium sp. TaxID=59620 RepID=UPI00262C1B68|nr:endonuclease/exonuclease/phosphatase family protein [uncultured Clostridium sp.]
MKLLTLNCHSWQEENQLEKIEILAKTIIENDYDIISLQEVSQKIDSEIAYENIKIDNYGLILLEKIKELGGVIYDFFWDFSHIGYDIYEEGLCLLTKQEMKNKESFFLTKSNDKYFWKTRKILCATVGDTDIYSCHLGWFNDDEEPFEVQCENLANKIKERKKKAILMGDFNNNAFTQKEGYDMLKNLGLVDSYSLAREKDSGVTIECEIAGWEGNKEKLRIDIVFVTEKMKVLKCNTIFNDMNKEIISDHYGVEVEIEE